VRGPGPLARCVRKWLPGVSFPAADAPYRFSATLRMGLGRELGVVLVRWHALTALHEHTVRNAILARLEQLPACAREALADGPSVAIEATLRAETDGVVARPKIAPTTVAPERLADCLADHLAGLELPGSHTYTEVTMFFHLVQTTGAPADGTMPVLKMSGK
jgi:hypothetical protein